MRPTSGLTLSKATVITFSLPSARPARYLGCAHSSMRPTTRFRLRISGDAAMAVRQFWQQVDPNTGALRHDFTDPDWNTRFLGDLYRDLSEAARKRYALLQTPEFVEEFILDRTLTPAISEFGYRDVTMIDPTCGSGHFLLGGFHRLVDEWAGHEPARNSRDIAQRALDAVAGVDLNPFAVAISRFRLLVAALKISAVHRLADAPDFQLHVAIGDSLLHGQAIRPNRHREHVRTIRALRRQRFGARLRREDLAEVRRILRHAVPRSRWKPTVHRSERYGVERRVRKRYTSCHMQYSLGAPFTERFFELAYTGRASQRAVTRIDHDELIHEARVRRKLVTEVLPQLDLTHVIDTAGAYIPGHGTPTVILFGRHRAPVADVVRTVMGIKGEPSAPQDPARGLVWSAILRQVDVAGSESNFVSVSDLARPLFGRHPWSIGGGGASDLKEFIQEHSQDTLGNQVDAIGFYQDTHADEIFLYSPSSISPAPAGHLLVDHACAGMESAIGRFSSTRRFFFLTTSDLELWRAIPDEPSLHWLWAYRTTLWSRSVFGGRDRSRGRSVLVGLSPVSEGPREGPSTTRIAFVATHNHFVREGGGRYSTGRRL